jgi:ComF family protein
MRPPPLEACVAAVDYAHPWSDIVARFKFRDEPGMASRLAGLMREAPGANDLLARADLVLPVPLSRERLATRGYKQALLLARKLAPHRAAAQLQLRVRDTAPQAQQSLRERTGNMRHAFAVEPLKAANVAGRQVLLIDDVKTSGATLLSAADVLRQAGAAGVAALMFARTAGLGMQEEA